MRFTHHLTHSPRARERPGRFPYGFTAVAAVLLLSLGLIALGPIGLSGLLEQAPRLLHGAVSASGGELLHWSYNRRTFLPPDSMRAPVIHCDPVPDFLDRLNWLGIAPDAEDAVPIISMAGRSYRNHSMVRDSDFAVVAGSEHGLAKRIVYSSGFAITQFESWRVAP